MPHFVEELQAEAERAIAAMQEAALAARRIDARAELMRHMRTTAAKSKDRPKADAIEAVVAEWMEAWHLSRTDWPHVEREMKALTEAFYDYAHQPDEGADRRVRESCGVLESALEAAGTTLSDQMAWRSMCAHGWWESVRPVPRDLPGRTERPTIPGHAKGTPFWETRCAPQCL